MRLRFLISSLVFSFFLLVGTFLLINPSIKFPTSRHWHEHHLDEVHLPDAHLRSQPVKDSGFGLGLLGLGKGLEENVDGIVKGGVIMSKLGNATVKAELGRSTWKLLHTMAQRFPENPTQEERTAFSSFIYLFSRLYPCGECAAEFQQLLSKYPPQTGSRTSASMHLCFLHNQVNHRLGKSEFDCSGLEGLYDCGCGDDGSSSSSSSLSSYVEDRSATTTDEGKKSKGEDGEQERKPKSTLKKVVDPLTGEELIEGRR